MDHLKRFEDLVSAIKANGVPEDYLFCKLFKYSLAGEASDWLKQLPLGSLTSWAKIKNAIVCHFFDEARTEELRSKIATFTQEPTVIQKLLDQIQVISERLTTPWIQSSATIQHFLQRHRAGISDGSRLS